MEMAEIGYGVSSSGSLLQALSAIPNDYRPFFRDGFGRIGKLKRDQWPTLVDMIGDAAPYPSDIELEPISEFFGIEPSAGTALVTACRFLLGLLSLRSDSPKEFVDAAIESKLISPEDRDVIIEFADIVARNRTDYKTRTAVGSLRHAVLPSLSLFDVKVDLRMEFVDGKVSLAAPVLVVHIDTDTTDNELWFQMSPAQIVALEAKLRRSLEDLKAAQSIADRLI